jgi:16S rRNA (guanine966-N2)-methyltransferase
MRISGGKWCGRIFNAPTGYKVRPTQERVREAVFSILASVLPGARFLDLYAGSGVVGLEAFSRGAGHVTWIEKENRYVALLRENLELLSPGSPGKVICADAPHWVRGVGASSAFDVVFADPPYGTMGEQGFARLIAVLGEKGVVAEHGFFVAEMATEEQPPEVPGWTLLRNRTYGGSRIALYRRGEGAAAPAPMPTAKAPPTAALAETLPAEEAEAEPPTAAEATETVETPAAETATGTGAE